MWSSCAPTSATYAIGATSTGRRSTAPGLRGSPGWRSSSANTSWPSRACDGPSDSPCARASGAVGSPDHELAPDRASVRVAFDSPSLRQGVHDHEAAATGYQGGRTLRRRRPQPGPPVVAREADDVGSVGHVHLDLVARGEPRVPDRIGDELGD